MSRFSLLDPANAPLEEENSRGAQLAGLCREQGQTLNYEIGPGPPLVLCVLPDYHPQCVEDKGATLWPASEVLARFVAMRLAPGLPERSVIELGCGAAALPGLVAARLGANVTLTDFGEIATLAGQNAVANGVRVRAIPLDWGSGLGPDGLPPVESAHIVLAADVLYERGAHASFLDTICWATAPNGVVFIGHQRRYSEEVFFTDALPAAGWATRRLDLDDIFASMGKGGRESKFFRSALPVWACWRSAEGEPRWCKLEAAREQPEGNGDSDDSDNDEPPMAPPEDGD